MFSSIRYATWWRFLFPMSSLIFKLTGLIYFVPSLETSVILTFKFFVLGARAYFSSATTTTQTAWQPSLNSSRNSRYYFSEHIYQRHEYKIDTELPFNSVIFLAKLKSFEIHKKFLFLLTNFSSISKFFCFLSELISRLSGSSIVYFTSCRQFQDQSVSSL